MFFVNFLMRKHILKTNLQTVCRFQRETKNVDALFLESCRLLVSGDLANTLNCSYHFAEARSVIRKKRLQGCSSWQSSFKLVFIPFMGSLFSGL